ncbi:MAG: DUF4129 domain-containing protein [Fuerstiella sp.]|nr:DUF4129 domain-containing protein [Fuerstiella sp.]MDG2128191.1 DUF4129 domain-containing protein [Fuerstiella sp.]
MKQAATISPFPIPTKTAAVRWCPRQAVQALLFLVAAALAFAPAAKAQPSFNVSDQATVLNAQTGKLPSEQIRQSAGRVMQRNDYRSVRRRVLENIVDDTDADKGFLQQSLRTMSRTIGDFFEWIFTGLFSSRPGRPARPRTPAASPTTTSGSSGLDFSFGQALLYVGLAVLTGIIIWLIATVLKHSDGSRSLNREGLFDQDGLSDLSIPPGELAASTYETRALQMANSEDFGGAIRELLIGSMSWIERAGLIRFRKGLTNRDYVRAVWRQEDRRLAYGSTALEFERIYFGRREATREMFQNCLQNFQGSFREEETTTAEV